MLPAAAALLRLWFLHLLLLFAPTRAAQRRRELVHVVVALHLCSSAFALVAASRHRRRVQLYRHRGVQARVAMLDHLSMRMMIATRKLCNRLYEATRDRQHGIHCSKRHTTALAGFCGSSTCLANVHPSRLRCRLDPKWLSPQAVSRYSLARAATSVARCKCLRPGAPISIPFGQSLVTYRAYTGRLSSHHGISTTYLNFSTVLSMLCPRTKGVGVCVALSSCDLW